MLLKSQVEKQLDELEKVIMQSDLFWIWIDTVAAIFGCGTHTTAPAT